MSSPKQQEGGSTSWTSPGIFCGRRAESRPPHPLLGPSLSLREGLAPTLALPASLISSLRERDLVDPGWPGGQSGPAWIIEWALQLGATMELFLFKLFFYFCLFIFIFYHTAVINSLKLDPHIHPSLYTHLSYTWASRPASKTG